MLSLQFPEMVTRYDPDSPSTTMDQNKCTDIVYNEFNSYPINFHQRSYVLRKKNKSDSLHI